MTDQATNVLVQWQSNVTMIVGISAIVLSPLIHAYSMIVKAGGVKVIYANFIGNTKPAPTTEKPKE